MSTIPLQGRPPPHSGAELTREQRKAVAEAVWSIGVASRYPFTWARCLQRSLALLWWLGSRGVGAELQIGVRKDGRELQAHAWVEYQGMVLNDHQHIPTVFSPLAPAARRSAARETKG